MARSFAGTDKIVADQGSVLAGIASGTFGARVQGVTKTAGTQNIFGCIAPAPVGGMALLARNNGVINLAAWDTGGSQKVGLDDTTATDLYGTGWHHMAVAYDTANGGTNALYVDGASGGTNNSSGAWSFTTTASSLFWAISSWSIDPFVGNLAEAFWYDQKLTADEVAALAKGYSPLLIRPTALIGYWPLIGRASPEPNYVGELPAGTLTGTGNFAHPRIIMPRSRQVRKMTASAAATRFSRARIDAGFGYPTQGL